MLSNRIHVNTCSNTVIGKSLSSDNWSFNACQKMRSYNEQEISYRIKSILYRTSLVTFPITLMVLATNTDHDIFEMNSSKLINME